MKEENEVLWLLLLLSLVMWGIGYIAGSGY